MSIFYPLHQERVIVALIAVGFLLGAVYDLFKIKHLIFGKSQLIIFVDDFLVSLIFTCVFLFGVFIFNNGIIRWFEIASCICGFVLYRMTLSKIIMPLFEFIINQIIKLIRRIAAFVLSPFIGVYKYLSAIAFVPLKRCLYRKNYMRRLTKSFRKITDFGK